MTSTRCRPCPASLTPFCPKAGEGVKWGRPDVAVGIRHVACQRKRGKVATLWRSGAAQHVVIGGPLTWGKVATLWRSGATFL